MISALAEDLHSQWRQRAGLVISSAWMGAKQALTVGPWEEAVRSVPVAVQRGRKYRVTVLSSTADRPVMDVEEPGG